MSICVNDATFCLLCFMNVARVVLLQGLVIRFKDEQEGTEKVVSLCPANTILSCFWEKVCSEASDCVNYQSLSISDCVPHVVENKENMFSTKHMENDKNGRAKNIGQKEKSLTEATARRCIASAVQKIKLVHVVIRCFFFCIFS